jgi:hypothetical protein
MSGVYGTAAIDEAAPQSPSFVDDDDLLDLHLSHETSSPIDEDDDEQLLGDPFSQPKLTASSSDSPSASSKMSAVREAAANAKIWNLDYYKPYFDVSTELEVRRLRKAILPFKDDMYRDEEQPDLYGPFWIVSTLAFLMAAMSNFSKFLHHTRSDASEWNGDVQKITSSASFLYGALFVVPTVTYAMLRSTGATRPILELISLYGYSLVAFVPTCIICVLPIEPLHWVALIISLLINAKFLHRNIIAQLPEEKKQKPGLYLLIWFTLTQVIIGAVLKFYFFNYDE